MLKRLGIPLIVLALLVLLFPVQASAKVHWGVYVGPSYPAYPYAYPAYPYAPYPNYYVGPYPAYSYGPGYAYPGGAYFGWSGGHHYHHDWRGHDRGYYGDRHEGRGDHHHR